jgi:serine/threonine protein kinase
MKCKFYNLFLRLVGLPPFYSENMNDMYELILKAPLKFPSFVPEDAQSLLNGLLERDESKRLGSDRDYLEIQEHEFFKDIDWDKLYKRKVEPPFIPDPDDGGETAKNFDTEFTSEKVEDSFAVNVKGEKDANFDEFTFQGKSEMDN